MPNSVAGRAYYFQHLAWRAGKIFKCREFYDNQQDHDRDKMLKSNKEVPPGHLISLKALVRQCPKKY